VDFSASAVSDGHFQIRFLTETLCAVDAVWQKISKPIKMRLGFRRFGTHTLLEAATTSDSGARCHLGCVTRFFS
jgi:hypothetical protein